MYHRGGLVLSKYSVDLFNVLEVHILKGNISFSSDHLQAIEALHFRVVQVINYQNIIALIQKLNSSVGADVT